jgi:adenylate cyclase
MIEIERKFLVLNHAFEAEASAKHEVTQGYLSRVPERTVRVRIIGQKAFITIKGVSNESGLSRFEWEKEIDTTEAKELLGLCEKPIIAKTRYIVPYQKHIFEVDVFSGANKGLVLAEIELETETTFFEKPSWLGKEVTGDKRYYNAFLSAIR